MGAGRLSIGDAEGFDAFGHGLRRAADRVGPVEIFDRVGKRGRVDRSGIAKVFPGSAPHLIGLSKDWTGLSHTPAQLAKCVERKRLVEGAGQGAKNLPILTRVARRKDSPTRQLHADFYGKHGPPIDWKEYRRRYLKEMSHHWRESRYMRHNVALVPQIAAIEQRIASRTIYHIPREQVSQIESRIRSGDVICITGRGPEGFTEHVGLAYRDGVGVVHFMHASKDERRVVIDVSIRQYVYRYHKFAGIMVVRPLDVSTPELSRMAEN